MRSQQPQLSFGRTRRITLKRAGSYSSVSETSSPSLRKAPPQSGQLVSAGSWTTVSRGSSAGSSRRAGLRRTGSSAASSALPGSGAVSACAASSSSRRSSSCSMRLSIFSDLRPNCSRFSFKISSFIRSISLLCDASSTSCARHNARNASRSRDSRSSAEEGASSMSLFSQIGDR